MLLETCEKCCIHSYTLSKLCSTSLKPHYNKSAGTVVVGGGKSLYRHVVFLAQYKESHFQKNLKQLFNCTQNSARIIVGLLQRVCIKPFKAAKMLTFQVKSSCRSMLKVLL